MFARQRGFAGLVIAILLLVVVTSSILGIAAVKSDSDRQGRDAHTRAALVAAKEALLAFATSNPNRGYLPCPADPNYLLPKDEGLELSDCVSGGLKIGRLPWRTLGIGELRDGNGDPLWYAVSLDFADSSTPINRDVSIGQLSINGAAGYAAVVFSAGTILGGQSRSDAPATCSTTATSMRADYCPANYLDTDSASGISNADSDDAFTSSGAPSFNDHVLGITADQFFAGAEKRVLQHVRACLLNYAGSHSNQYPWPAEISQGDPTVLTLPYEEKETPLGIGRLPEKLKDPLDTWAPGCPLPHCEPGVSCPSTKFWIKDWRDLVFYAVAPGSATNDTRSAAPLQVGTHNKVRAAILLAGKALPSLGQSRTTLSQRKNEINYLEDNNHLTYGTAPQQWDISAPTSTFNDQSMIVFEDP